MTIKEIHLITFSPTHTSRQVGEAIVRGLDIKEVNVIDLTRPCDIQQELPADALAVITVPVYGGHIAPLALKRMQDIRANHTPAVIGVVYGNRAYEHALQELDSFARSMYETNQSYTIVYPVASNPLYVNSMSYFVNDHFGWESVVAGQIEQLAIDVFYHNNISVRTYFDGIVSNYSKTNWDARFSGLYGEN